MKHFGRGWLRLSWALAGVALLINPALREFHFDHPEIALEFTATADLARFERG